MSYRGVQMLKGDHRMYMRKMKSMTEEGIARLCRTKNGRAIVLDSFERKSPEYIEYYPGFRGEYIRYGQQRAKDVGRNESGPARAQKAIGESDIFQMMYAIGVGTLPPDKTRLDQPGEITEESTYYTDAEIKNASEFKVKFKEDEKSRINTRAQGLLTSPGGDYVVYLTRGKKMRWSKSSEYQVSYSASQILNQRKSGREKCATIENSIIYFDNGNFFQSILNIDEKTINSVTVENGYRNTYLVPYTETGRDHTALMVEKDWQERLKQKYLSDADRNIEGISITCDGIEDGAYVLLFCIPNITRLSKFLYAARWEGRPEKYRIYCYDYQADWLKEAVGGYAEIYTTSFRKVL